MRLLLDTCTLIWLTADPERLSERATAALDAQQALLALSDVSVWELGLKWRTGKIRLPEPPRRWVEAQTRAWRLEGLKIERRHLYRESELPRVHLDPFDRLLVAQAIEEDFVLVTPDAAIARYPVGVI